MNWKLIRIIDSIIGIPLIYFLSLCAGDKKITKPPFPKKILLIKFWGIGNIFMLTPTIKGIQETSPEAEIDFLTLKNNHDAISTLKIVDLIITINTDNLFAFISSWHNAVKTLKKRNYDIAIDFEQFARFSAIITFQAASSYTIGFKTLNQHRHHLYNRAVEYNNNIHITESFYSLAENAGVTQLNHGLCIKLSDNIKNIAENKLAELGIDKKNKIVLMHIGTSENFKERRWEPQKYAELCDLLIKSEALHIILTGLAEERDIIDKTISFIKQSEYITDCGGKLSFTEYFAIISLSSLVISADTAAVHIASALDIPVVALYGPNTPTLYGPWGKNGIAIRAEFDCSPCITNFNAKINNCRHPKGKGACMKAIETENVFNAAKKLLETR